VCTCLCVCLTLTHALTHSFSVCVWGGGGADGTGMMYVVLLLVLVLQDEACNAAHVIAPCTTHREGLCTGQGLLAARGGDGHLWLEKPVCWGERQTDREREREGRFWVRALHTHALHCPYGPPSHSASLSLSLSVPVGRLHPQSSTLFATIEELTAEVATQLPALHAHLVRRTPL
jgi:hypothetical protein